MNEDELRAFIRAEVRKALQDREVLDALYKAVSEHMVRDSRMNYKPRNLEYKDKEREDMPDWARG